MSQPLSPALMEALRRRSQEQREATAGNSFTKYWPLTGEKALVPAGGSIVGRLLPRWDYALSRIKNPAGTGTIANPEYNLDAFPNVTAIVHWWKNSRGGWAKSYCPKTLYPSMFCLCCAASVELLRGNDADKKDGKQLKPKTEYIYNAVFDYADPKKVGRQVAEDGLVDIRIVGLSQVLDRKVNDIMTGGEREAFAKGNIMHPADGYDLLFKRPAAQGQEWDVVSAPEASRLYGEAQAASFKNWVTRMINLEEMLKAEVPDDAGIWKAYKEREATPQELADMRAAGRRETPGMPAPRAPISDEGDPAGKDYAAVQEAQAKPESAAAPESPDFPDDDFMPQSTGAAGRAPRR